MARAKPKMKMGVMWANVLKFLASLIFLYVIFAGLSGETPAGAVSLWVPLLFAGGIIGTIVLFFASLAGLAWPSSMLSAATSKAWLWSSFLLLALTAASGTLTITMMGWEVIAGFLIGLLGVGVERM